MNKNFNGRIRLIDADALKKYIIGFNSKLTYTQALYLKAIDEQPTYYDIDKVVDELEDRKKLHERLVDYETKNGTVTEKYQHIKAIDVLNDAIEIVKQGGVANDVCEKR